MAGWLSGQKLEWMKHYDAFSITKDVADFHHLGNCRKQGPQVAISMVFLKEKAMNRQTCCVPSLQSACSVCSTI